MIRGKALEKFSTAEILDYLVQKRSAFKCECGVIVKERYISFLLYFQNPLAPWWLCNSSNENKTCSKHKIKYCTLHFMSYLNSVYEKDNNVCWYFTNKGMLRWPYLLFKCWFYFQGGSVLLSPGLPLTRKPTQMRLLSLRSPGSLWFQLALFSAHSAVS